MSDQEQVICIPAPLIRKLVAHHGTPECPQFIPAGKVPLAVIQNHAITPFGCDPIFLPRSEAETNFNVKHLISYVIVNVAGGILTYERGKAGGEGRLHGLLSIGVGGHVAREDFAGVDPAKVLEHAARRELDEELACGDGSLVYRGMLSDDSSDVNRVHLGLIYEFMTGQVPAVRDHALEGVAYRIPSALKWMTRDREFESWSAILIDTVLSTPRISVFPG